MREPGDQHAAGRGRAAFAELLDACVQQLQAGAPIDLHQVAGGDQHTRQLVQQCLPALELLRDATTYPRAPLTPHAELSSGQQLGEFTVIREIGRGGMAVVYEAFQASLQRRVALKVLTIPGPIEGNAMVRFERESKLVARLRHPGIVPILAIGQQAALRWIAMELVAGAPLDRVLQALREQRGKPPGAGSLEAAVAAAMSDGGTVHGEVTAAAWAGSHVAASIRIVLQIADALAHAHEAGVVHRDVKPANIIVRSDGSSVLTDFGLARDLAAPSMTAHGELAGTPSYVSPEQAAGRTGEVDQRTDVFSLGVTLYELITLARPFPGDSTAAILAAIAIAEPIDPRRFSGAVSNDLAAILLQAIARRPQDRYPTAAAFAADLRAFLDRRPIRARRISLPVRVWRWSTRERTRAVLLTALLISAATVTSLAVHWRRTSAEVKRLVQVTQRSDARAAQIQDFLERLLSDADPFAAHQSGLPADSLPMVQQVEAEAGSLLTDAPELAAVVRRLLGNAWRGLGNLAAASSNLEAALAASYKRGPAGAEETAKILICLAAVRHDEGRYEEARSLLEQTEPLPLSPDDRASVACLGADLARHLGDLDLAERLATSAVTALSGTPDNATASIDAFSTLGMVRWAQGRVMEARELRQRALRLAEVTFGPDHLMTALGQNNLGVVLHACGDTEGAERMQRSALQVREHRLDAEHPQVATACNNLGVLLNELGRLQEAEPLLQRTFAIRSKRLPAAHPALAESRLNLAAVEVDLGRYREADELLRPLLPSADGSGNGVSSDGAVDALGPKALLLAGRIALHRGDAAGAGSRIERAIDCLQRGPGADSVQVVDALLLLGSARLALGDVASARDRLDQAMQIEQRAGRTRDASFARVLQVQGCVALRSGQPAVAIALHERAAALWTELRGEHSLDRADCLRLLADDVAASGDVDRAEALLGEGLTIATATPLRAALLDSLAELRRNHGRPAAAVDALTECLGLQAQMRGADDDYCIRLRSRLARTLEDAGRLPEAERQYEEVLAALRRVAKPTDERLLATMGNIANVLELQGELARAESWCQEWLEMVRDSQPAGSVAIGNALAFLGRIMLLSNEGVAAEPVLRECLDLRRALAADDWRTWNAQGMLATAISQQGRAGEAEPMLREAYERMQPPTAQAYRREQLRAALVTTLRALGRTAEADRLSRDK